jgi:glutathione S-transferase
MRRLYHYWLCPESRAVRIALCEKKIDFDLEFEKHWECREDFLSLNPSGRLPVFIDGDSIVSEIYAIFEYLEESYPDVPLLQGSVQERAEIRRLISWFTKKFSDDVEGTLLKEKTIKRFTGKGAPCSTAIRAGKINLSAHLDYIGYLVERRRWLGGDHFSYADIIAAAHLSALDYLGDVPWERHSEAKEWYARIKSRPSFRTLLQDNIPGMRPSRQYMNLDF